MKVTALISVTLAAAVGLGCAALSVESVESASTEGDVDSEWVKQPFTASPLAPLANTYWKFKPHHSWIKMTTGASFLSASAK